MRLPLLMLLPAVLVSAACGRAHVDASAVAALPLEAKLDLLEAENDLFIAVDALDEARTRVLETREDYRRCKGRIQEAKDALELAKETGDTKRLEVGDLSITESYQRRDWLDAFLDVQWALFDVEKAKLDLARGRLERFKAQMVKKANLPGSQKLDLKDFDDEIKDLEAQVKSRAERAQAISAEAEKVRAVWYTTRRTLAQKTGGAQGSPWVE